MSKANERQVGGDHYRQEEGVPQHWDLTILYGWDPFQYQITKYVMRWKNKNGVQDLEKARHFLDKYIENYKSFLPKPEYRMTPGQLAAVEERDPNFQVEGFYGSMEQVYKCRHCGTSLRAKTVQQALEWHGNCPAGQGYVNQG